MLSGPVVEGEEPGSSPVVDTPGALAVQREILSRASVAELEGIAAALERKSAALRELLAGDPSRLSRAGLRQVLGWVFATRRRAEHLLDTVGAEPLALAITALMGGPGPVEDRFDRFDAAWRSAPGHAAPGRSAPGRDGDRAVTALDGPGFDLPGEMLHFTSPDRYWLWTRWIWDPQARTGALALVTTTEVGRSTGATRGAVYLDVGRATAFVDEAAKAVGPPWSGRGPFGIDVFLAAAYVVHVSTVVRLRMSREVAGILPPLTELVRRLLGVYQVEG